MVEIYQCQANMFAHTCKTTLVKLAKKYSFDKYLMNFFPKKLFYKLPLKFTSK